MSVYLSGLYQLLEARVTTFSRLCHLQGKLDLILAQSADDGTSAAEVALTTPLLTVTLGGQYAGEKLLRKFNCFLHRRFS